MPRRVSMALIWWPTPRARRRRAARQSRRRRCPGRRLPATPARSSRCRSCHDDEASRKRSSHGSASTTWPPCPGRHAQWQRRGTAHRGFENMGWVADQGCRRSSHGHSRASGRWSRPCRLLPACRVENDLTSRGARSTKARSSPTPPERHTVTPLIATSMASGSKRRRRGADRREDAAPVGIATEDRALEPVVARDGPRRQAHRFRCRRAHIDPDVVRGSLRVPHHCMARSAQTSVGPARSRGPARGSGGTRGGTTTVSLVDMQPSESGRRWEVAVVAPSPGRRRRRRRRS